MAGADLRHCGIGYFGWLPGAAAVPTHIPSYLLADISYRYQALPLAHQPAHSSNPKTFQLRTIAALPEPAGRPTHGLLSRRSTDRISTSPLANFAQLSMFRFDGLKITLVMGDGNNLIYNYHHISYNALITK
ncbi:hypothetical protein O8H69_003185 [Enterobacter hormaechei]